jgi:hypothetical protein
MVEVYFDEPSDDVIAACIFSVIVAVGDGTVTLDQVKAQLSPNTGDEFFQRFLVDGSA